MTKARLETFSDGVVAILITIMVLELKMPQGHSWASLWAPDVRVALFTYLLSFVNIAIYWNNHHHMLHAAHRVNGTVLWANTHLLLWLSFIPFSTRWLEESDFAPVPTAIYAIVLFVAGLAAGLLQASLIRVNGRDSTLARATGADYKGKISFVLTGAAIPLSLWRPMLGITLLVVVSLMWLIPDSRVERTLAE